MADYRTAKGWLRPEEREALFQFANAFHADGNRAIFVNIGVEYGASLACLRAGALEALIYGIDIDISKAVSDYGATLIEDTSQSFRWNWPDNVSVDLLFVDGDHTYLGVAGDTSWMELVRQGGYALFHDCYDFDDPGQVHRLVPGVNRAVQEWFEQHKGSWEELTSIGTMRIFRRMLDEEGHRKT